jgi:sulfate adenylyltransferase subunit 1
VTEYFRYPVQYVIRPISSKFPDFRGYAGRVAGGKIKVGDKVRVLPSGQESTVTRISQADRELEEATSPLSIDIQLANDIDISRGDTLVKADEPQPQIEQDVTMDVCWFNETPAQVRKKYIVRQTTSETLAIVRSINFRRNINTLEKEQGVSELKMNDIAEITIHTANPLVFDRYQDNRITGSVIFIDPDTNETVGAGMIK